MNVTLDLSIEEVTTILRALSTGPYEQVVNVISNIQTQASGQLNDKVETKAENVTDNESGSQGENVE